MNFWDGNDLKNMILILLEENSVESQWKHNLFGFYDLTVSLLLSSIQRASCMMQVMATAGLF